MTTGDGWAAAVRSRLSIGRLLPLGGPMDGAWLAERAAADVLRRAASEVRGVSPGTVRVALVDPGAVGAADFPPPPGAIAAGALRIEADFDASGNTALPVLAEELRSALFTAADERLGLVVTRVDLRVTGLMERVPGAASGPVRDSADGAPPAGRRGAAAAPSTAPSGEAARAALDVEGVAALTTSLGPSVHTAEDHVRVELATLADHRALNVARTVRTAVGMVLAAPLPVTVLVTEVRQ